MKIRSEPDPEFDPYPNLDPEFDSCSNLDPEFDSYSNLDPEFDLDFDFDLPSGDYLAPRLPGHLAEERDSGSRV